MLQIGADSTNQVELPQRRQVSAIDSFVRLFQAVSGKCGDVVVEGPQCAGVGKLFGRLEGECDGRNTSVQAAGVRVCGDGFSDHGGGWLGVLTGGGDCIRPTANDPNPVASGRRPLRP
jgi:hypothetical protein